MDNDETKKRRKKLRQMRDAMPDDSSTDEEIQGAEILAYAKTFKERKDKRKKQFSIIKGLFEDPLTFDLDKQVIPTSSSNEEIASRQKELQYRIDILKAILEIAEAEMQLLSQATQSKNKDTPKNASD
jgi:hypothetical protein